MDSNLLFILIFVAMTIADAVGRRRKKRDRIEEMERAEREEWAQEQRAPTDGGSRSGPTARQTDPGGVEEWEWEGSGTETRGELPPGARRTGAGSGAAGGEEQRETADTLVPDDLWAILTGEAPQRREAPPVSRAPSPTPDAEQSRAEREFEELTTQPWRAGPGGTEPASSPQSTPPAPASPAPAAPSRTKLPSPVSGRTSRPVPGQRMGRKPLPTRETMSAPSERFPSPARSGDQPGRKAPDRSDVPWQDISAGEIGSEGGSFLSPLQREIGAPAIAHRREFGASLYVRDIRSAGREGLRRAIVLREVLGPPVSLRPAEKRVWEAWDE